MLYKLNILSKNLGHHLRVESELQHSCIDTVIQEHFYSFIYKLQTLQFCLDDNIFPSQF